MKYEDLEKANKQLSSIDVKGKDYVMVTERVKAYRSICPGGLIETEILDITDEHVVMKATVYDSDGVKIATGHAEEKSSSSFINKTSYVENCETSAIGRALGLCGIGIDASFASAEEVANAIKNQDSEPKPSKSRKKASRVDLLTQVEALAAQKNIRIEKLCEQLKVNNLGELTDDRLENGIKYLQSL